MTRYKKEPPSPATIAWKEKCKADRKEMLAKIGNSETSLEPNSDDGWNRAFKAVQPDPKADPTDKDILGEQSGWAKAFADVVK